MDPTAPFDTFTLGPHIDDMMPIDDTAAHMAATPHIGGMGMGGAPHIGSMGMGASHIGGMGAGGMGMGGAGHP
jgi:hypothetical protein